MLVKNNGSNRTPIIQKVFICLDICVKHPSLVKVKLVTLKGNGKVSVNLMVQKANLLMMINVLNVILIKLKVALSKIKTFLNHLLLVTKTIWVQMRVLLQILRIKKQ